MPNKAELKTILNDNGLAQFGDAFLNFAYSLAITNKTGKPQGARVPDRILAEAAVKAGLRAHLPRRVSRGDVANSTEALLGWAWLEKLITLDEVLNCLESDRISHSQNFADLAELAVARLMK